MCIKKAPMKGLAGNNGWLCVCSTEHGYGHASVFGGVNCGDAVPTFQPTKERCHLWHMDSVVEYVYASFGRNVYLIGAKFGLQVLKCMGGIVEDNLRLWNYLRISHGDAVAFVHRYVWRHWWQFGLVVYGVNVEAAGRKLAGGCPSETTYFNDGFCVGVFGDCEDKPGHFGFR